MNVPRPSPRPTNPKARRAPRPKPPKSPRIPWGWLEWLVISQTLLPALLFLPGVAGIRTPIRAAAYLAAPFAWLMLAMKGRASALPDTFPARNWLIFSAGWLALSIAHPNGYSIPAAAGQAALYIAVMTPAFWAAMALTSSKQISRVMTILFVCNALSSVVGVGQVYRPNIFNPPDIPMLRNKYQGTDIMYKAADGTMIMRPCGLTDTPGAVSPHGAAAALLGLCLALRPGPIWRRAIYLGLGFIGVAAIYYTYTRFPLVMLVICFITMIALFIYQRDFGKATMLAVGGTSLIGGAFLWALRSVGAGVFDRFAALVQNNPADYYYNSRGGYIQEAFDKTIWEYPLGYGMGWWGQINLIFNDPNRISPVWVEVMIPAWIVDGGIPLFIGYSGAIVLAMLDTLRIALRSPDRDVAYWGVVIFAFNMSTVATSFSYITYLSPLGVQFWLLAAMIHAADARARLEKSGSAPARPARGRFGFARPA